jgi:hypothetical protein
VTGGFGLLPQNVRNDSAFLLRLRSIRATVVYWSSAEIVDADNEDRPPVGLQLSGRGSNKDDRILLTRNDGRLPVTLAHPSPSLPLRHLPSWRPKVPLTGVPTVLQMVSDAQGDNVRYRPLTQGICLRSPAGNTQPACGADL